MALKANLTSQLRRNRCPAEIEANTRSGHETQLSEGGPSRGCQAKPKEPAHVVCGDCSALIPAALGSATTTKLAWKAGVLAACREATRRSHLVVDRTTV